MMAITILEEALACLLKREFVINGRRKVAALEEITVRSKTATQMPTNLKEHHEEELQPQSVEMEIEEDLSTSYG